MEKKLTVIFIILVLITSACGAQTPVETVAPTWTATQPATETQAPTATETQPVQASATPETPIPTNTVDCINGASFVDDVTIPDRSDVAAGSDFIKTWRVKNTGTCTWGPTYTLAYYSDEQMGALSSIPLAVTLPGETVDLSMDLRAASTEGIHRGNFVIKNPAGFIMKIDNDSRLWVIINVTSAAASGTTSTPAVVGGAGSTATSSASSGGSGSANAACASTTDAVRVKDAINAINAYREQNGLTAYTVKDVLTDAATAHANDMACNKLFAHNGSNGSTPTTRVAASGYLAASVSENVYGSYPPLSGQAAVDWWKNDKTDIRHNQNLLSTTFTEIGVGYSFFDNFGYYVLVFAKPK